MDQLHSYGDVFGVVLQCRMVLGLEVDTQQTKTQDAAQATTVIITAVAFYGKRLTYQHEAAKSSVNLVLSAAERLMRFLECKTQGQGRAPR